MERRRLALIGGTVVAVIALVAVFAIAAGGGDTDAEERASVKAMEATARAEAARSTTTVAPTTTAPVPTTPAGCALTSSPTVFTTGYAPRCVSVASGTTVTWTWNSQISHSVTSDAAGLFDSGVKGSGSFEYTFTEPGTYGYYCTVHGRPLHTGTVEVT